MCTRALLCPAPGLWSRFDIVRSLPRVLKRGAAPLLLGCALAAASHAATDGASAYLPLNLEPEMERQVERKSPREGYP